MTMSTTFSTFNLRNSSLPYENERASGRSWAVASKVPQVAIAFWIIKIAATTVGETGGDALSMTMNLGYLVSTFIFLFFFIVAVTAQIKAKTFHRFL